MSLEFSRDGSVIIEDGDRVYQGNYQKENNLVYVTSPGVPSDPLEIRAKDELVYTYFDMVQVFKKH